MVFIRRPDKLVIRRIHQVPYPLNLRGDIVYKLFRRNAGFFRFQLNLLPVLIRTCLEEHIVSLRSLIARDRVRKHDFIGVSDVRLA